MGLEFLFHPWTFLVFLMVNIVLVLMQRTVFSKVFEEIGLKKVAFGYFFVLILCLVLGLILGKGTVRESAANFMLACYISLLFVSIGLLPVSLLLMRCCKIAASTVFGVGVLLVMLIGVAMVLPTGADGLLSDGLSVWLSQHIPVLGHFIAVSAAFSVGLTRQRK